MVSKLSLDGFRTIGFCFKMIEPEELKAYITCPR